MKRIYVRVVGTCPLLQHKFSDDATAELGTKVKRRKTGPPDAKEEAEASAYRLDQQDGEKQGQLCMKGEHFFQSMVLAAGGFQISGQGKKTYRDAVKGNLFIEPDFIGLTDGDDRKLYDYRIDSRPARIKQARISRRRPLIEKWAAEFDIVIADEEAVSLEIVNHILVSAGQTKGIGDYRPRFGRFMVERFEEMKG